LTRRIHRAGGSMFGTVLITIITLMHLYVFWRLASTPLVIRVMPRAVLIVAGLILWLAFVLGRLYGHDGEGRLAATSEFIGMNWMAVLFLMFFCILIADVITGFGLLWPKGSALVRTAAVVVALGMAVTGFVQGFRTPVVETYEVSLPGLSKELDGTTVVALADLHLGSQIGADWLAARVTQVQALKPDMIFLLGDIFEGHGPADPEWLSLLKSLSAPLGKWAVLGNHEFHGGSGGRSARQLEDAGFQVLRDQWVDVGPGLILAGVDDLTTRSRRGLTGDFVTPALKGKPAGPTILLTHSPLEPETPRANGVNLILNGHTHGGQIWPMGYLTRLRYPFLAGRYNVDDLTVIVSRGAGTWGPRMRLWKPGDIVRVILRAG
jgi:predicted MPP superfamily phosphohydrolase